MDLLVKCTVDNTKNKSITDIDWVIKNIRYRKQINKTTIVEYFYKKFYNKGLYLRNINQVKYLLNKRVK